jgi:hypothetical protein
MDTPHHFSWERGTRTGFQSLRGAQRKGMKETRAWTEQAAQVNAELRRDPRQECPRSRSAAILPASKVRCGRPSRVPRAHISLCGFLDGVVYADGKMLPRHFLNDCALGRPAIPRCGGVEGRAGGRRVRWDKPGRGSARRTLEGVPPCTPDYFSFSANFAKAAVAQAASLSPPGAPLTAIAPIVMSPALMGTPPWALIVPAMVAGGAVVPGGRG